MGKSIRSKKAKRLRTQRRELVEGHYQKKEDVKQAVLAAVLQQREAAQAALAQPMVEEVHLQEGASAASLDSKTMMAVDKAVLPERAPGALKPQGGVKKGFKVGGPRVKMSIGRRRKMEKKAQKQKEFPV
eukprot:SM000098S25137  [mRNA]  locus=s98:485114:485748:+ [translate_table: standard]